MSKFTPIKRDGRRVYITGMAATSISEKSYALSRCSCGAEVAWAQSSKTGKWYPCETHEYMTEAGHPRHRAAPYQPHKCIVPEPIQEPVDMEAVNADIRAKMQAVRDEFLAAGDTENAEKV